MSAAPHLSDDQLSAHIDSALDPSEAAAAAAHLDACRDCGERLARLRATSRAVAGLPVESPPRAIDFRFTRAAPAPLVEVRSPSRATRLLRARTPAWATGAVAIAAVLVLALAIAPGLRRAGGGASTSTGLGVGGPVASGAASAAPSAQGAAPADRGAAAPGSLAQRGGPASRTVAVPNAGGVTLTLSAPSNVARRGDVLQVSTALASTGGDQGLGSYSLAVAVVAGQPAPVTPGAAGGTVIGSTGGTDLVLRGGGTQDYTFTWVSTLGTSGAGGYTLIATLISPAHSTSVSILITLT